MTSLAARLRTSAIPERIVGTWNILATRWNPLALIVIAWAALAVPLVFFRGYNSDEGLAVSIARTALEDGDWFIPHMFNVRWIERPTLLSWIIAAISEPFGHVSQITARLPIVLFLLFGCLLIYFLLRKVGAGVAAALFGTALFLACPLVMRAYVMITADMPLAVLLFFAFVLWWDGTAKGSIGLGRWTAIGIVLAFAGLLKGPQPVAYFALGVGVFVLGSRSWRQLPGLILAGLICAAPLALWYAAIYRPGDEAEWAAFMRVRPHVVFSGPLMASLRLLRETVPAALCAAVYLVARGFRGRDTAPAAFVAALACYAFIAPLFVLFWPGGSAPRYYFPMVLPLCVFGGLAYDRLAARRPEIVATMLLLTAAFLVYALGYAIASPLLPMRFRPTEIEAARIAQLVQAAPGPIYRTGDTALNVLPYVPGRILNATPDELGAVSGPAWMVLPAAEAEALLARRPDKLHVVMPVGEAQQWRLLRLDP
jgi:4-amino-4-deoxy-L-arabinose transferase-like glycosyltransferase